MTGFPKKPPLKSEKNLEFIRQQPCIVCGRGGRNEPDHLRTRGAQGGDELVNLIPSCKLHHQERHQIGLKSFVDRYKLPVSWDETGYPRRNDLDGDA